MNKGMFDRRDKLIKKRKHHVYPTKGDYPEPTVCTKCGVVYTGGRWSWEKAPENANQVVCPACRRIAGNLPAGYITIRGAFFEDHREEILNLVRNIEKAENSNYPLERTIAILDQGDHTLITTTGIHIARRIGEALSRSYQGEYSFQYAEGEKKIRVYWER